MGEPAANRLIDIIEGTDEEEKQTVYLAAQLHERASSRRLV
jgi:DNA-binding LacI/PurR family transcriptional regulator